MNSCVLSYPPPTVISRYAHSGAVKSLYHPSPVNRSNTVRLFLTPPCALPVRANRIACLAETLMSRRSLRCQRVVGQLECAKGVFIEHGRRPPWHGNFTSSGAARLEAPSHSTWVGVTTCRASEKCLERLFDRSLARLEFSLVGTVDRGATTCWVPLVNKRVSCATAYRRALEGMLSPISDKTRCTLRRISHRRDEHKNFPVVRHSRVPSTVQLSL